MTIHLDAERIRFVELRRRLLELHPDLDEQTLADTLEGATDLKEALAALVRSALDDECLARALKDRVDAMRERLARLEARASSKRQVAVETMETTDLRKFVEPDFTATIRIGPPSVSIVCEEGLPGDLLTPPPPRPEKPPTLEALTAGALIPGAVFSEAKVSLS